jgi:hypothetical protein
MLLEVSKQKRDLDLVSIRRRIDRRLAFRGERLKQSD